MLELTPQIKQEITDFCNSKYKSYSPLITSKQNWYFDELQNKLNSISANTSKDIKAAVLRMLEDDLLSPKRCSNYRNFLKHLLEFVNINLTNNQ